MTADEFAALVTSTGWSVRTIAQKTGIPRSSIGAMMRGEYQPDEKLVKYLERVALAVDRVPLPNYYA